MKNKENLIKIIVAVLIVAGVSFYAGTKFGTTQKDITSQARSGQFGGGAPGNRNQRMMNGGFVGGEILSKDGQSITIKLRDGGSNIVFFNASTTVTKGSAGNAQDIAVGAQVTVTGNKNPDGSVNAQSIQIRP